MAFLDETGLSELWACVNERASKLANAAWKKYKSYTTKGSYTWTAPDISGDGSDYLIGVMVIGGGGSGGAIARTSKASDETTYARAMGGASGFATSFVMTVTPGTGYPVVVGAGGSGRTATVENASTTKSSAGASGGTSSFNGITALGGGGGDIVTQDTFGKYPPKGGVYGGPISNGYYGGAIGSVDYYLYADPLCCFNPFEGTRILGSGGGAYASRGTSGSYGGSSYSGGKSPITGKGGGNGAYHSGSAGTATATAGNEPGAGGGAAASTYYSSAATITSKSGAGAAGAVYIYIPGGIA